MIESDQASARTWWNTPLLSRFGKLQQREDQVFLVLALVIGGLTGAAVVAFILLTEPGAQASDAQVRISNVRSC